MERVIASAVFLFAGVISIYVFVIILIRLFTWYYSWKLQRKYDIRFKVGSVGFLCLKEIFLQVENDITLEVEYLWLSSGLFHSAYRTILVLCISDIRLHGDVVKWIRSNKKLGGDQNTASPKTVNSKFASFLKRISLHLINASYMQLGSSGQVGMLHTTIQELSVFFTTNSTLGEIYISLVSATVKIFKHISKFPASSDSCLAQLSMSIQNSFHIAMNGNQPFLQKTTLCISQPEIIFYENLSFKRLLYLLLPKLDHGGQDKLSLQVSEAPESSDIPKSTKLNKLLPKIPLAVEAKVENFKIKLMREEGQRTLSLDLKAVEAGFKRDKETSFPCASVLFSLQDFSAASTQTQFVLLNKANICTKVKNKILDVSILLSVFHVSYQYEELEYWLGLIPSSPPVSKAPQKMPMKGAEILSSFFDGYHCNYKVEIENVAASVKMPISYSVSCGVSHGKFTMDYFFSLQEKGNNLLSNLGISDFSSELLLEVAWCRIGDGIDISSEIQKSNHIWNVPLALGMLLLKVKHLTKKFQASCTMEGAQIEWSPASSTTIQEVTSYFEKASPNSLDRATDNIPMKETKSPGLLSLCDVKMNLHDVNIFALSEVGTALVFRIDNFVFERTSEKLLLSLEGTKIQHIIPSAKAFQCVKSAEATNYLMHLRILQFDHHFQLKEANLQLLEDVEVAWNTTSHMTALTLYEEITSLKKKFIGKTHPKKTNETGSLVLYIKIQDNMVLEAKVSKSHRMSVLSSNLVISLHPNRTTIHSEQLCICFDEHKIFTFQNTNLVSFNAGEPNVVCRQNFDGLELEHNKAWNICIDEVKIVFPYQYNFAEACSEQTVSVFKWLKLIHKKKKKPFTVDSPLPPDVSVQIKVFSLEIGDDPFEVKLRYNFKLLEDEYHESVKRKKLLDEKIQKLVGTHLLVPAEKLEGLYATLACKDADIYIQRSKQLYQRTPERANLLIWRMEEVDILTVADRSYHGKENVMMAMQEIDDESPYPEEGLEFTTLWCRTIQVSATTIAVTLRNFPQSLLEIRKLHIWGRLIGAEQEGSPRAKRVSVVEVGEPWTNVNIERNMASLKFYHDLTWDMETLCIAYGVCWEPVMAQVNLAMEYISRPSADPSPALPWWDKNRLLFHGRHTFCSQNITMLVHASLDPYNTMEQMEVAWSDVIIAWTNAKILTRGDLDIYVRTASKYDDCRLLHMPKLKLLFKFDWLCLGNPNDHHSVMPCAPDKIPEYSINQVHDSYRAFRSENMSMFISLETKSVALETAADIPTMLLYSSTLRWIENLKMIHAGVPKLIRRGKIFSNTKPRKQQLGRHYRDIRLALNLHKFQVCYWMSFAKQRGLELLGGRVSLSSEHNLSLIPVLDGLQHRPSTNWKIAYLNCELGDSEIWLYNYVLQDKNTDRNKSLLPPVERSYFLSVTRVSYGREAPIKEGTPGNEDTPTHRLVVHGLKGAWTTHNRDVIFNLFDSYMKAKLMKRNLSTEALKGIKVDNQPSGPKFRTQTSNSMCVPNSQQSSSSPVTQLQSGFAAVMLQKLIAEAEANPMVYTEEIDCPIREQQLHGVAACQTDDVLHKNWLIELVNCQVMLKGSETSGYVIVSAAKSQILQRIHCPVWKDRTLVSKTTWVGSLECMQYYATVDAGEPGPSVDNIMWLSLDNIEERASLVISDLADLVGSGQSVGGVVSSTVGGTSDPTTAPLQLQRIVSRCGCQFFYASYGENIDSDSLEVPPLPEDDDLWGREVAVDSFTLTHHDLDICTNSLQYAMILDMVNNLLLYVESHKKEASERLKRMRFQLELCSVEEQKGPILQLQNQVRSHVFNMRRLEKEAYLVHRMLCDNPDREDLMRELEHLEREIFEQKEQLTAASEELAIIISCYKEKQVTVTKTRQRAAAPEQEAPVVRRSEVCFRHARWRLTDADGQLGIADLVLSNFLYSKVTKADDSVEHLLELGYVKMTNLLPNNIHKIVLQPTELQPNIPLDRQRALRIFCRERAPVAGISVKEHLELNIIPITIGLTYAFFTTMLKFFFPGRDATEEHHADDDHEASLSRSRKHPTLGHKQTAAAQSDRDDIDKMKERAEKNHTFLYVKIPEVPIKISYKGEKDKNIEDLNDCCLLIPTLEYHNRTWTWLDLLMEIKNATKRILVSQAIKQKILKHSRTGTDETSQPQEEEKMKLLFGTKVVGCPEKNPKKSLFSKIPK